MVVQKKKITAIRETVAESPGTWIRHCAEELDISTATLHRTLAEDWHFHAHKIQLAQQFPPKDHAQRREFTNWIIEQ